MNLSEEDKKRIQEEEEYRAQIRKERAVARESSNTSKEKYTFSFKNFFIAIMVFALICVAYALLSTIGDAIKNINKVGNAPAAIGGATPTIYQQSEEERNKVIQEISTTFCSERSKPNVRAVNLDDFIEMMEANGKTVTLRPAYGAYPTSENCQKVTKICIDTWGEDDCRKIAHTQIWIGMGENELILSVGVPKHKNNTTFSSGTHTQWVYGDFGPYVYLEGYSMYDMKVTSWQD